MAALCMGGLGFLPLFGGPGYESALAAGLLLPSIACVAAALFGIGRPLLAPLEVLSWGLSNGALVALTGGLVILLHGWRVGMCDPSEGLAFFALGPGAGTLLAGAWGALVGIFAGLLRRSLLRTVLATGLALLAPLVGVGLSAWRFYTSPMVFAFDPFFGYFAGTLYDTVITGMDRLVTYRVGSVCSLLAAVVLVAHLERQRGTGLGLRRIRRPAVALLGIAAAAASIALTAAGARLGHYQSVETIRAALGRSATSKRCEILYPSSLPQREAHALGRQCDAHVGQLERTFALKSPERISVYVFASPEQKGELMGASHTYIAKPWRREVYVHAAGYPHPVLRHELAHVLAASFAQGPFRVAGPLRGWLPDPGRIEGLAVAAAPGMDDELTLQEWARAMQRLELLPPLRKVFELRFLGEPSSRAYTVAGAFVEWLVQTRGIAAVERWYGGTPLEAAAGAALGALEREWHQALRKVPVGEQAMHVARARFDRPAVFRRRCPHVVDRMLGAATQALGRGDLDEARRLFGQVLALDPRDVDARLGLGTCAERAGDTSQARTVLSGVANDHELGRTRQADALEALGDLALLEGDTQAAIRSYDAVSAVEVNPHRLRTLDVKRYAAGRQAREALVLYLIGTARQGRNQSLALARLGRWSAEEPEEGLADYLLARAFFGAGSWDAAADAMDRALARSLTIPSVKDEALRTRILLACERGEVDLAQRLHAKWLALGEHGAAQVAWLAGFVQRCTLDARRLGSQRQELPTPITGPSPAPSGSSGAPPREAPPKPVGTE